MRRLGDLKTSGGAHSFRTLQDKTAVMQAVSYSIFLCISIVQYLSTTLEMCFGVVVLIRQLS